MSPQILRTVAQVRSWRHQHLLSGLKVGLVPTMGALHAGHCSLIKQSMVDNDKTVVSIFVNPSQFAPHEDLDSYPRTFDRDMQTLLSMTSVDAVFVPPVSEMYPSGIVLEPSQQTGAFVNVKGCSEQLEGKSRPLFFRGVATVVTKLLNAVTPENVYFGQKDAQQCVVIKNLVKDLLINTKVNVLPTLREQNGLAMSSRNEYLSAEVREKSAIIYSGLSTAKTYFDSEVSSGAAEVDVSALKLQIDLVWKNLPADFSVEYLAVTHPETLQELEKVDGKTGAIISTAVRVPKPDGDEARLIDNVVLG